MIAEAVIAVEVADNQGKQRTERALIDSGAEENCIRQSLALECGWIPNRENGAGLVTLDGKEVWTYGTHNLPIATTDSIGDTRSMSHRFMACDFEGLDVNLILGYPWLRDVDPTIGFPTGRWRYAAGTAKVDVVDADQFYVETESAQVYSVQTRPSDVSSRIGTISARQTPIPEMYEQYADVFDDQKAGVLPEHHPMEHKIEMEAGKEPPWSPVYPLGEPELKALREYLDSSLDKGWIRRSISPAGAPILFVPKKDGGLRLCVDYRGLNAITIRNRTPLPLISETLDRLRRSKIFTKLDLKDAYH